MMTKRTAPWKACRLPWDSSAGNWWSDFTCGALDVPAAVAKLRAELERLASDLVVEIKLT